jgi:Leucine-rich repeat (LRR) protein
LSLTELELNDNQITTIPKEIGNLINLTMLDFFDNQITTLPKEIETLIKQNSL